MRFLNRSPSDRPWPRVVVVGAGFAGLEPEQIASPIRGIFRRHLQCGRSGLRKLSEPDRLLPVHLCPHVSTQSTPSTA